MIQEAYVSFEVAKLLKEKGFEGDCFKFYTPHNKLLWSYLHYHDFDIKDKIDVPTHQMAMAWLRTKHGLHITIIFSKFLYGDYPFYWSIDRMIDDKREKTSTASRDYTYKSPEEAVEAALKYALENLV